MIPQDCIFLTLGAFVGAVATDSRYDMARLRDDVSRLDATAPDGGDRQ
jgi:hypothetical protein